VGKGGKRRENPSPGLATFLDTIFIYIYITSNVTKRLTNIIKNIIFPIGAKNMAENDDSLERQKEMNVRKKKMLKVIEATAPANPQEGTIFSDSDDNKIYQWTGETWIELAPVYEERRRGLAMSDKVTRDRMKRRLDFFVRLCMDYMDVPCKKCCIFPICFQERKAIRALIAEHGPEVMVKEKK